MSQSKSPFEAELDKLTDLPNSSRIQILGRTNKVIHEGEFTKNENGEYVLQKNDNTELNLNDHVNLFRDCTIQIIEN